MNNLYFSDHLHLLWLVPSVVWAVWLCIQSDASIQGSRKWISLVLRIFVLALLCLALAGFEWRTRNDNLNVLFLVDRSLSVPQPQQEFARNYINSVNKTKKPDDRAGVIVFGKDAGIELMPNTAVEWGKFQSVVDPDSTELGNAIRLATAAFPENGQKKLVVLSDGNANIQDVRESVVAARTQDVTIDVVALGASRSNDVLVKPLQLPGKLKKSQAFTIKSVVSSTTSQSAVMRVYRNGEFIAQEPIQLTQGENAFSFQETLDTAGFFQYEVQIDAAQDDVTENNKSYGQTYIEGDPTVLLVTGQTNSDLKLLEALELGGINVSITSPSELFANLDTLRFFDSIILSNVGAGHFSRPEMALLESLVKDFGVGMVAIGGDDSFTAGSYRGTPLESLLPLSMELDSKKVIPRGALVLIMHGMEFINGNAVARQMALGTLEALGEEDELGVLLWDGTERWLIELERTGNKKNMRRTIAGMNQGDLPNFQGLTELAYKSLENSSANIKHIIYFSDGDPSPPSEGIMGRIRDARITASSVLIAGHASDANMVYIAEQGNGNFYNITDPNDLPQIFLQETAIILKSAIIEESFIPEIAGVGEPIRGINSLPQLNGYVATVPKDRAAVPVLSTKGDPIFAYWNYGLGRVAAFTSDARPKWAADWIQWPQFAQFWQQIVQWSLRRLGNSNLDVQIVQNGSQATVLIEAIDPDGNYLNFLNLQGIALAPNGKSGSFEITQLGPGQYRASIPVSSEGSYQFNILEREGNAVRSATMAGTSISYSPEFQKSTTDTGLLTRLADWGGGQVIDPEKPEQSPFSQGRKTTYSPSPIWDQLVIWALLIFLADIALRRIDLDWVAIGKSFNQLIHKKRPAAQTPTSTLTELKKSVGKVKSENLSPPKIQPTQSWVKPSSTDPENAPLPRIEKKPKIQSPKPEAKKPSDQPAPSNVTSKLLEARRKAKNNDDKNT